MAVASSNVLGRMAVQFIARTDQFDRSLQKSNSLITNFTLNMAKAGAAGLGIGLAAKPAFEALTRPIAEATKQAIEFENRLAEITTILDNSKNLTAMRLYRKELLNIARTFGIEIPDAVEALREAISAGIPESKALDTLASGAKLARATVIDLSESMDAIRTVVNSFNLELDKTVPRLGGLRTAQEKLTRVNEVLFETIDFATFRMDEYGKVLGRIAPVANLTGISFEEMSAAMAALSRQGFNAREAAVRLNRVMISFIKPTVQAREAVAAMNQQLGLTGDEAIELNDSFVKRSGGLLPALQKVKEATDATGTSLTALFTRQRALQGVGALLSDDLETFREALVSIHNETGALNREFETMQTTLFKLDRAMVGIQTSMLELGTKNLPIIGDALDYVQKRLDGFNETLQNSPIVTGTAATAFAGLAFGGQILSDLAIKLGFVAFGLAALSPLLKGTGALLKSTFIDPFKQVNKELSFFNTKLGGLIKINAFIALQSVIENLSNSIKSKFIPRLDSLRNTFNESLTLMKFYENQLLKVSDRIERKGRVLYNYRKAILDQRAAFKSTIVSVENYRNEVVRLIGFFEDIPKIARTGVRELSKVTKQFMVIEDVIKNLGTRDGFLQIIPRDQIKLADNLEKIRQVYVKLFGIIVDQRFQRALSTLDSLDIFGADIIRISLQDITNRFDDLNSKLVAFISNLRNSDDIRFDQLVDSLKEIRTAVDGLFEASVNFSRRLDGILFTGVFRNKADAIVGQLEETLLSIEKYLTRLGKGLKTFTQNTNPALKQITQRLLELNKNGRVFARDAGGVITVFRKLADGTLEATDEVERFLSVFTEAEIDRFTRYGAAVNKFADDLKGIPETIATVTRVSESQLKRLDDVLGALFSEDTFRITKAGPASTIGQFLESATSRQVVENIDDLLDSINEIAKVFKDLGPSVLDIENLDEFKETIEISRTRLATLINEFERFPVAVRKSLSLISNQIEEITKRLQRVADVTEEVTTQARVSGEVVTEIPKEMSLALKALGISAERLNETLGKKAFSLKNFNTIVNYKTALTGLMSVFERFKNAVTGFTWLKGLESSVNVVKRLWSVFKTVAGVATKFDIALTAALAGLVSLFQTIGEFAGFVFNDLRKLEESSRRVGDEVGRIIQRLSALGVEVEGLSMEFDKLQEAADVAEVEKGWANFWLGLATLAEKPIRTITFAATRVTEIFLSLLEDSAAFFVSIGAAAAAEVAGFFNFKGIQRSLADFSTEAYSYIGEEKNLPGIISFASLLADSLKEDISNTDDFAFEFSKEAAENVERLESIIEERDKKSREIAEKMFERRRELQKEFEKFNLDSFGTAFESDTQRQKSLAALGLGDVTLDELNDAVDLAKKLETNIAAVIAVIRNSEGASSLDIFEQISEFRQMSDEKATVKLAELIFGKDGTPENLQKELDKRNKVMSQGFGALDDTRNEHLKEQASDMANDVSMIESARERIKEVLDARLNDLKEFNNSTQEEQEQRSRILDLRSNIAALEEKLQESDTYLPQVANQIAKYRTELILLEPQLRNNIEKQRQFFDEVRKLAEEKGIAESDEIEESLSKYENLRQAQSTLFNELSRLSEQYATTQENLNQALSVTEQQFVSSSTEYINIQKSLSEAEASLRDARTPEEYNNIITRGNELLRERQRVVRTLLQERQNEIDTYRGELEEIRQQGIVFEQRLEGVTSEIEKTANGFRNLFDKVRKDIESTYKKSADSVRDLSEGAINKLIVQAENGIGAFKDTTEEANKLMVELLRSVPKELQIEFLKYLTEQKERTKETAENLAKLEEETFNSLIKTIKESSQKNSGEIFNVFKEVFNTVEQEAPETGKNISKGVAEGMKSPEVLTQLQGAGKAIGGTIGEEASKGFLTRMYEGLAEFGRIALQWLRIGDQTVGPQPLPGFVAGNQSFVQQGGNLGPQPVPGFARGVAKFRGGSAMLGEAGIELVGQNGPEVRDLPSNTFVLDNKKTKKFMASLTGLSMSNDRDVVRAADAIGLARLERGTGSSINGVPFEEIAKQLAMKRGQPYTDEDGNLVFPVPPSVLTQFKISGKSNQMKDILRQIRARGESVNGNKVKTADIMGMREHNEFRKQMAELFGAPYSDVGGHFVSSGNGINYVIPKGSTGVPFSKAFSPFGGTGPGSLVRGITDPVLFGQILGESDRAASAERIRLFNMMGQGDYTIEAGGTTSGRMFDILGSSSSGAPLKFSPRAEAEKGKFSVTGNVTKAAMELGADVNTVQALISGMNKIAKRHGYASYKNLKGRIGYREEVVPGTGGRKSNKVLFKPSKMSTFEAKSFLSSKDKLNNILRKAYNEKIRSYNRSMMLHGKPPSTKRASGGFSGTRTMLGEEGTEMLIKGGLGLGGKIGSGDFKDLHKKAVESKLKKFNVAQLSRVAKFVFGNDAERILGFKDWSSDELRNYIINEGLKTTRDYKMLHSRLQTQSFFFSSGGLKSTSDPPDKYSSSEDGFITGKSDAKEIGYSGFSTIGNESKDAVMNALTFLFGPDQADSMRSEIMDKGYSNRELKQFVAKRARSAGISDSAMKSALERGRETIRSRKDKTKNGIDPSTLTGTASGSKMVTNNGAMVSSANKMKPKMSASIPFDPVIGATGGAPESVTQIFQVGSVRTDDDIERIAQKAILERQRVSRRVK